MSHLEYGFPGRVVLLVLAGAGLFLSSCASTTIPEEHLYLLPLPGPGAGAPGEGGAGKGARPFLVVPPVAGTGLFRGDLLWARISDMEVESWVRHRWALPAPEVVRRALLEWGRKSGLFRGVTDDPSFEGEPRIVLRARLLALEEVDRPGGAVGRVELELEARKAGERGSGETKTISWRGAARGEAPVEGKTAADVVRALGRAFREAMDEVLVEWTRAGILEGG